MRRSPSIPPSTFVGRESELGRVEHALESVALALIVGVPGVGKSALLGAAAAKSGRPVVEHAVRSGETLADVVDDLRRKLAKGRVRQALSDEDRVSDLIDRLERINGLLLIDDLHRLGDAAPVLLASLGGALENARAIVASRERPHETARDPLRFELRLDSLDEAGARGLWTLLDDLYGKASGFERAFERTRGNPLLLRRAHAGDLDTEDPVGAAIEQLDDEQRFIATALALAETRLSRPIVDRLLPEGRGLAALRELVRRLIVATDGEGAASLHDLFRASVLARAGEPDRRRAHSALADALEHAPLDVVSRVREVSRHLSGAGRNHDWVQFLLREAKPLVRLGASAELARALGAIPEAEKSVETETVRARALARTLDLHRAYAVLESLIRDRGVQDPEVSVSFGRVATLLGRFEEANRALRPLLENPPSDGEHRLRSLIAFALLATHEGRGEEVRRALTRAEAEATDPLARAMLAGYRAFTYWLDETDEGGAEIVARARALGQEVLARADSLRAAIGLPYGLAATLARTGRIEEAEALLEAARAAPAIEEDVLIGLEYRLVAGDVLRAKGERIAALSELESVSRGMAKGGYLLGQLWADVFRARVLRVMGRVQAADRLDAQTEAAAKEHGIVCVLRALERSRAIEPGATALEALKAGARGDTARLEKIATSLHESVSRPGYGLDRALLALGRALAAEAHGRAADAERERRAAFAEAEAEKVDPDLLAQLMPTLGTLRVVSSDARFIASNVDTRDYDVVLDARAHTLAIGDKSISLKNRQVVRGILYGFAREPGHFLGKELLAEAAWGVEYDPRVHDGALKVNLLRLRALLRDTRLSIEHDSDGYRLRGLGKFLFVEPLNR